MTALSFVWAHPYSQNSRCDNTIPIFNVFYMRIVLCVSCSIPMPNSVVYRSCTIPILNVDSMGIVLYKSCTIPM